MDYLESAAALDDPTVREKNLPGTRDWVKSVPIESVLKRRMVTRCMPYGQVD